MKCPTCGEPIADTHRLIIRDEQPYYQTTLAPRTIRIGDVEADSYIFTEDQQTMTRTLFDSADYCSHCGDSLTTAVPDTQRLIHEYD